MFCGRCRGEAVGGVVVTISHALPALGCAWRCLIEVQQSGGRWGSRETGSVQGGEETRPSAFRRVGVNVAIHNTSGHLSAAPHAHHIHSQSILQLHTAPYSAEALSRNMALLLLIVRVTAVLP